MHWWAASTLPTPIASAWRWYPSSHRSPRASAASARRSAGLRAGRPARRCSTPRGGHGVAGDSDRSGVHERRSAPSFAVRRWTPPTQTVGAGHRRRGLPTRWCWRRPMLRRCPSWSRRPSSAACWRSRSAGSPSSRWPWPNCLRPGGARAGTSFPSLTSDSSRPPRSARRSGALAGRRRGRARLARPGWTAGRPPRRRQSRRRGGERIGSASRCRRAPSAVRQPLAAGVPAVPARPPALAGRRRVGDAAWSVPHRSELPGHRRAGLHRRRRADGDPGGDVPRPAAAPPALTDVRIRSCAPRQGQIWSRQGTQASTRAVNAASLARSPDTLCAVISVRSGAAIAAAAIVLAGVGATAATAATTTSTTTTTVTLPVPVDAPTDDEPEPQTFHGRLQIPAIEVDSPFIEGIRLNTLDYGPDTGLNGDARGARQRRRRRTPHEPQRRLPPPRRAQAGRPGDLRPRRHRGLRAGRRVPVSVPNPDAHGQARLRGPPVEIVTPESMWVVTQDYRHSATLFACHPPGSVAERIVVFSTSSIRRRSPSSTRRGRRRRHRRPQPVDDAPAGARRPGRRSRRRHVAPLWGWWPLAFAGVALFELSLGEFPSRRSPCRPRLPVRLRLAGHRDGVDVAAHRARLHRRQRGVRLVPRRRRRRRPGRAVEHDRPAVRPHPRRGRALLLAVRRCATRQPRDCRGCRPVRRSRPRRRGDPAHVGGVPGRFRPGCWRAVSATSPPTRAWHPPDSSPLPPC